MSPVSVSSFERRYREEGDPWNLAGAPYEQRRYDLTAGFGRSWTLRSEHRGQPDRLIVVTEIGLVATDIGGVVTGIGRDAPAGGPSSTGRMAGA